MTKVLLPEKALYFPHIQFRSVEWVKCALLYWEGVKRIVPHEGYSTDDPPEVAEFVAAGLVEDVPATSFRESARQRFAPRLAALM